MNNNSVKNNFLLKQGKQRNCWIVFFLLLIPLICNCQAPSNTDYLKSVGDILFDSTLDNKNFYLCNEKDIMQYHNDSRGLEYKGEKIALTENFIKKYIPVTDSSQNGLIRIRFVVNCKGATDRYRIIAMDEAWQPKIFDKKITDQLMAICKGLDGWVPKKLNGKEMDYYQYLIFKIEYGLIKEIMP